MVLTSSLLLSEVVTCNGFHVITAADVDNLERESGANVTAVDKYGTLVYNEDTAIVGLDQVSTGGSRMAVVRSGGEDCG